MKFKKIISILNKYRWAIAPSGVGFLILLITFASGSLYIKDSRFFKITSKVESQPTPTPSPSSTPSLTPSPSSTPVATKIPPKPKVAAKPTSNPTSQPQQTNTPNPTSSPNPTATPSNTPNPTTQPRVVCEVHFDPTSGTAPIEVKLIYAAAFYGVTGDYVTNVQWDWDGDGNWDTDFSVNNQHLTHTYTQAGTYTPRMHLQTRDGLNSDVCSKSITIN